ncbi:YdeI family protein [Aureibaculum sp. 2210JD6-5]|uniref:YdeI/OmpD-associated family protein n=1 Tax=Aureibaculum sp. 2210JD6-5 TaxID=3103957 RepID=UPI002AAE38F0|nr:YdeI family protein [Aureibaculum sp. 2210JD6-5]MDY7394613.1 YdeI family protein [Aureibaculum sp. 2210JD6-5]
MEKVENYIEKIRNWKEETKLLRDICLDCGLDEDFKWMHPCYTFQGKNIVLIHGFKGYCALLFHKGALLKDTENILIQQTENVQSARQIRFTNLQEIIDLKSVIKTYIFEAIEVEEAGSEVKMKKTSEFKMPEEFKKALDSNSDLKTAFYALTPGRQRGYLLYFSQAKQSKTRESRIEKYTEKILNGEGLNDNYKK